MTFPATAIVVSSVVSALGFWATHPEELRQGRFLRILVSLPILLFVTGGFYGQLGFQKGAAAVFALAILAFLWSGVLAYYTAGGVGRVVFGNPNARTGVRADFGIPRAFERRGEFDEAIQHTVYELEKEPMSYEGLCLLSSLYEQVSEMDRSLAAMETLLKSAQLTPEQTRVAQARAEQLRDKILIESINAR
jgi:hypothetical protein